MRSVALLRKAVLSPQSTVPKKASPSWPACAPVLGRPSLLWAAVHGTCSVSSRQTPVQLHTVSGMGCGWKCAAREALHPWVRGCGVWKIGRGLGAGPAVQPRHFTVVRLSDVSVTWKQLADGRELNAPTWLVILKQPLAAEANIVWHFPSTFSVLEPYFLSLGGSLELRFLGDLLERSLVPSVGAVAAHVMFVHSHPELGAPCTPLPVSLPITPASGEDRGKCI